MEEDVELADQFLAAYWRTSPVELDDHQNINVKITITPTIVSQFKKKKRLSDNLQLFTGMFFFCSKLAGNY